jgi:glucan phosphoethanolaminetransferase (alkaline phosphatase superfamily)
MEWKRAMRRFGLDVALWYFVPACFLCAYVLLFAQPSRAVGPHILLVTPPLLVLAALRLLLHRLTSRDRLRNVLVAMLMTLLFGLLLTYYVLVLVGLKSWGGVVAWNVIPTFFAQSAVLTDALAIPWWVLLLTAAALPAALFGLCWHYLKRFDWAGDVAPQIPASIIAVGTVAVAAIAGLAAHEFSFGRWTVCSEPLSLTFYPPRAVLDLEGYSVNPVTASHLDQLEDAARTEYRPAQGAKKNLVLIVADALRPDHLGVYGYSRQTTPNLTRIVGEHSSQIVRGMHSTCADTICALFSMFSSRFPNQFSFRPFTLHEALRRNGYRIHMLLSGDHTYFHSLRGFYGQVDSFYDGTQAKGYFINDDALLVDHLGTLPDWDQTPVMFQFHLMSSHILRKSDDTPGPYQPARRYALRNSHEIGPGSDPNPTAVNFYDNGVVRADAIINELLALLLRKGYLQNTLVVITADHGESLGEHGLFTHANSVREEVLNIPLILIPFGYTTAANRPERAYPGQVDIAPTLFGELGLPLPGRWMGHDLNSVPGLPLNYFEEHAFAGLIDRRDATHVWKYWIDRNTGVDHVFDLSVDPHENLDVRDAIPTALLTQMRELNRAATSTGLPIR